MGLKGLELGEMNVRTLVLIACLVAVLGVAPVSASAGSTGGESHNTNASTHHRHRAQPAAHHGSRKAPSHVRCASSGKHKVYAAAKGKRASARAATAKRRKSHAVGRTHTRNGAAATHKYPRHAKPTHKRLARHSGHKRQHHAAARAGKPGMVTAKAVPAEGRARLDEGVWHQPVPPFALLRLEQGSGAKHHFLGAPRLSARSVLVVDREQDRVLFEKNSTERLPIASITKLMTAMVVLDAHQPPNQLVTVTEADVDRLKHSRSRLPVGTRLTREELLHLALLASENRAASALSRNYPGGERTFVEAMNRKARFLGMLSTHFDDPTGLTPTNTSTARDLARLVRAAYTYTTIRAITSSPQYVLEQQGRLDGVRFRNTNRLVRSGAWEIGLSKTGYIEEAGRCLVMEAEIGGRPTLIILLHGEGRGSHFADAIRLRQWIERREMLSSNS
jgi:D-alanyl-D-alanine endopeptidase (penicillin-binding protein 7)